MNRSWFDERRAEREHMVETQIVARGIRDPRVLAALRRVPRHAFMPDDLVDLAHVDRPVPIGHGQTISQPYIVARMTEALGLSAADKVLEIGTGSGYQTAVLAELARDVRSIEVVEPLGLSAAKILTALGYDRVQLRIGDGFRGWPDAAPFDGIIVTAAPPEVPQPLLDQLAIGGRLVIPVGTEFQELWRITRKGVGYEREPLLPVRFVPMLGEAWGRTPEA